MSRMVLPTGADPRGARFDLTLSLLCPFFEDVIQGAQAALRQPSRRGTGPGAWDTRENRLTKYIIEGSVRALQALRRQVGPETRAVLDALLHRLRRLLAAPCLTQVSPALCPPDPWLAPACRALYRRWLALGRALEGEGTLFLPALPPAWEEALAGADWSRRDVLVGALRSRGQLNVALQNRFYHIPAARIEGAAFPIRGVALYQSKTLFGPEAGLRYYGLVTGCSRVPRYQITELPREIGEPYYRFEIQSWQTLPTVIRPKELGFVHTFTTEFLLKTAREIPELFLETEAEFRLYQALKQAQERGGRFEFQGVRFQVDPKTISLSQDNALLAQYPAKAFLEAPYRLFWQIKKTLGMTEET